MSLAGILMRNGTLTVRGQTDSFAPGRRDLILDHLFFSPPQSLDVLGLVIEKANYGCSLEEAEDLIIDVTTAVQALVNKSQLYIPGRQTKVNPFLNCWKAVVGKLMDPPGRTFRLVSRVSATQHRTCLKCSGFGIHSEDGGITLKSTIHWPWCCHWKVRMMSFFYILLERSEADGQTIQTTW